MKESCSAKKDINCKTCQPKCNATKNEYEYSQCSATQNRQCKDREILPPPIVSGNVVLEDLSAVEDAIQYFDIDSEGTPSFSLKRGNRREFKVKGSDFWIDTDIKHFNPLAQFRPVNHSDAMDKGDYPGSPDVLESNCPYPVPTYYQWFYTVHTNVSYKGNPMDDPDSLEPCQGELSNFPDMTRTRDRSVICSEPGSLTSVFRMNASYFTQTATEWLEKNDRCRREHEACENCTGACGLEMIKNSDQCSVNVNDDNGRSPRLPLCFTCCVRRQCADLCKFYHDDRCRMERCHRGNLVQVLLNPVYPRLDEYYCHIEQDPSQLLLQIEYTVNFNFQQQRTVLFSRNMSVFGDKDWQKTGRIFRSDGLIDVEIDSELKEIPNFIQRARGATQIKVGMYEPTGTPLETSGVEEPLVNIRPLTPFGIDPKSFGSKTCNDEVFKDVVKATVNGGLYRPMDKELVSIFRDERYQIRNKTAEPNIKFKLPKTTSILKAIYPPTRLKFNSLSGNMTFNKTHWIIMVMGELETCPGFLNLNLSDPGYPNTTIYQFAVGVTCHGKGFFINFSVPTNDSAMISKMFQIRVKDSNSTYQLMIYAPALETWTLKKVSRRVPAAEEVTSLSPTPTDSHSISILFIAVVSGAIFVLLFLLLFGVAWRQGIPEGSYLMFQSRHLTMLVVYITFQFVYAVVASMTVFVLITIAMNGETTAFLKQYKLQRSVKTALSQLELDQMELHMKAELLHLNSLAQQRKTNCENNIRIVMDDVSKLAKDIEEEVTNKVKKQNIKDLVTNHTKQVIEQFSRDLIKFREKYDKYEKFLVHKLTTEVESTYNSVQRSEWLLRGARFIHSFVFNIRTFQHSGATTMPFMEWANLETNMTQLAKGLILPLSDLPVLGLNPTAANPSSAPTQHHISNSVPVATETRNQWFIQPSLVPEYNRTGSESDRNQQEEKPRLDSSSYMIFFICMICIDILMLLHRMIKAIGTGKLLLYGYPIYVDVRDQKIESTPDEKKPLNNNIGRQICKSVIDKLLSTYFIPKLIGTIFVSLMVIFVLIVSDKFVNRETFKYLGYYNNIEDLMKINENVINSRIRTHAKLINEIEYPMYEQVMNVHIQRHQHVLSLVESQWRAVEDSQTRAYCTYLRRINVSAECASEQKDTSILGVKVDGCLFPPVLPQLYHRNRATSSKIAESQLDGFLSKIQDLISDTCLVVITYMAIIIMKELLGTVLWIYIKRSGFVSLRIIYETDESPGSADISANKSDR